MSGIESLAFFATVAEQAALEADLAGASGPERLASLVALAWQLRQCDQARALTLRDEALALMPQATAQALPAWQARLDLVQVEHLLQTAVLEPAWSLCQQVLSAFAGLGDLIGQSDAQALMGVIRLDQGRPTDAEACLAESAALARRAGDALRENLALASRARSAVLHDIRLARTPLEFELLHSPPSVSLQAQVEDYRGLCAGLVGEFGRAATHFMAAHESAAASGQLRLCIVSTISAGRSFSNLNDNDSALEWLERGMALARPTGWPSSLGQCLTQAAETLRRLGRLEPAQELLREALTVLQPLAGSRAYAITLMYLGRLSADLEQHLAALAYFAQLEARAQVLDHIDFIIDARIGEAQALSQLDRADEALAMARGTLELARSRSGIDRQIELLRVLANIHERHRLPPPGEMKQGTASLHYLKLALTLMTHIQGYTAPGDLLDQVAREYAKTGEYERAYDYSQQAAQAREKTHGAEATNRAIALQIHYQTETARAEGEHHRMLALAEVQRAQVLEQTSQTLERLGKVGQEITAHLDAAAVFEALNRHVQGLLAAESFAIYLMDADGRGISTAYFIEQGQHQPVSHVALDDPLAGSAQCLRERRDIVMLRKPEDNEPDANMIPGTLDTASRMFAPMLAGTRVLGVMTIQSVRPEAYGEREQRIFRTLCAYGAIALDNAQAYAQLQTARDQLVAQEKLASLGTLVAGVAQELNTPVGHNLLIATTLRHQAQSFVQKVESQAVRHSDVSNFVRQSTEAAEQLAQGLARAAKLVSSFQEVATDRAAERRRRFDLRSTVQDIVSTLRAQIDQAGHRVELDLPEHLTLDAYPGALGQVLTQLIGNALHHGLAGRERGLIQISARTPQPGWVRLNFRDDGVGLSEANLRRIFDPFFTTQLGQGSSGLGLYISHNIISSLFGGQIRAHSPAGEGLLFVIDLPLTAPK
nr:ATP-binding protein [uncultured Roseateles sp.]